MDQTPKTFLSPEFLKQYEGVQPKNKGILHSTVYLRTYSRWVPEKKRREIWAETVQRVVEYSLSLYEGPASKNELVQEAELMFDKIFNLEVLPAGRTLWVGGTDSAKKFAENQFNCSFCVIDSFELIGDLFQLLLCGCGVGFRVLKDDIKKLPRVNTNIKLYNRPYCFLGNRKVDYTEWERDNNRWVIEIGDSREGWVEALRTYLEAIVNGWDSEVYIELNYNSIRPEGSRIKGFGGRAPGHRGLQEMFENVTKVINKSSGKLTPVDVTDICNFIAKNVIVGGTRRSSQIALGSPDDQEFIDAKKRLWLDRQNLQRTMSNNSITFEEAPTREQISQIFEGIKCNGEPGIINLKSMRKRRPNAQGTNPCSEVAMDSRGFCNLTTINLMSFVEEPILFEPTRTFNLTKAIESIKLATRIGLRQTNVTVSLPKWDKIQKRDRLLGVSMTGIMDAFDALELEFDSLTARHILMSLREATQAEANAYAFEMRVPRPLLVTCLKPEGTLTLLTNSNSPGLHRAYAPYYIRRIRVSSMDPVSKALIELGVPHEPDQGKNERIVFSFPIKTEAPIAASDEPARRQLERYLVMMQDYVDHNASCTLTIGEDEWEEMEEMVYSNFDKIIGTAFLPKNTGAYPQMPYEAISVEKYEELIKNFPDLSNLSDIVNKYELEEFETELELECGGACPIR